MYPGAHSCVRYEKLREGIVDYEKIRMLREECEKSKDGAVTSLWKKFEEHLKIFTVEKEFNPQKITGDVDKGKAMIAELTDKLHP
jgi:hypothetical protein